MDGDGVLTQGEFHAMLSSLAISGVDTRAVFRQGDAFGTWDRTLTLDETHYAIESNAPLRETVKAVLHFSEPERPAFGHAPNVIVYATDRLTCEVSVDDTSLNDLPPLRRFQLGKVRGLRRAVRLGALRSRGTRAPSVPPPPPPTRSQAPSPRPFALPHRQPKRCAHAHPLCAPSPLALRANGEWACEWAADGCKRHEMAAFAELAAQLPELGAGAPFALPHRQPKRCAHAHSSPPAIGAAPRLRSTSRRCWEWARRSL